MQNKDWVEKAYDQLYRRDLLVDKSYIIHIVHPSQPTLQEERDNTSTSGIVQAITLIQRYSQKV